MNWFERLFAPLRGQLCNAGGQAPIGWSLEPLPQATLSWTNAEMAALLAAEQEARLCYAHSPDFDTPLQSLVLGFDLDNNHLLLDEFVPSPAAGLIDKTLTLTLPMTTGTLHLELTIIERVAPARQVALVGRITAKSVAAKTATAIVFSKGQAPAIDLLLPMNPLLRGQVLELSTHGLLLSAAATAKPTLYTPSAECKISFDANFAFACAASVKHAGFYRKPFRHSLIRLAFRKLTEEQQQQLATFIGQYRLAEEQAFRAA